MACCLPLPRPLTSVPGGLRRTTGERITRHSDISQLAQLVLGSIPTLATHVFLPLYTKKRSPRLLNKRNIRYPTKSIPKLNQLLCV
jgi:hypothetical protein